MAAAFSTAVMVVLLCCAFGQTPNAIEVEDAQPGTTAWLQQGRGRAELYASPVSAAAGADVQLSVSTADAYRLVVYRLGWYGGTGARVVACLPACDGNEQGHVQAHSAEPGRAAGWQATDVLHTDPAWASGYYLAEAELAHGGAATAFFVLREAAAAPASRILVQVPVNTWQAYNEWGGKSLYDFHSPRAAAVSFDRPLGEMAQSPLWWEIQLVRFLEREGYDVSYQTDVDTDADPASLLQHRLVLVAGHDEYWSTGMRDAFDAALAAGTNLGFMGSNDAYWHIRYEDDRRTIVTLKTLDDPNPVLAEKTALFREIGRPECMLMGVQHQSLAALGYPLDYRVTDAGAADPWLAGTGFHAGDIVTAVVGREHDKINPYPESCFHPGLVDLFHYDGGGIDQDADAVRFTAPSGARVFASGAQQFAWGLDDLRSDRPLFPEPPVEPWHGVPVDPRLQQFMRNALDDLTRPAAPAQVTVRLVRGRLRVDVRPSVDPRVRGFVAAVRSSGPWHRLCHGVTRCVGRSPADGGARIVVGVVAIDGWHRHSAAAFAVVRGHT